MNTYHLHVENAVEASLRITLAGENTRMDEHLELSRHFIAVGCDWRVLPPAGSVWLPAAPSLALDVSCVS